MAQARAEESTTPPQRVTHSSKKKAITGQKSSPTQKSSKKQLSKEYAENEAEGEDKSDYSEPSQCSVKLFTHNYFNVVQVISV